MNETEIINFINIAFCIYSYCVNKRIHHRRQYENIKAIQTKMDPSKERN